MGSEPRWRKLRIITTAKWLSVVRNYDRFDLVVSYFVSVALLLGDRHGGLLRHQFVTALASSTRADGMGVGR